MNDLRQTLKAGTLLIIETGEYSDRSWSGPVRLLRDCLKSDLADRYMKEGPRLFDDDEPPDPSSFLPWLVESGYAEAVESATSWHVGSYGRFDP